MKDKKSFSMLIYVIFLLATLGLYLIAVNNINIPFPQILITSYLILTLLTIVTIITSFLKSFRNVNMSKKGLIKKVVKYSVLLFVINMTINYFMNWGKSTLYLLLISVISSAGMVVVLNEKK